jgi:hypothetical protein
MTLPLLTPFLGKVHVPIYYFLCITFKKLYFKDGTTVSQVQLNQEKEQYMNDEEFAELIGRPFNDSNTSNSPSPST